MAETTPRAQRGDAGRKDVMRALLREMFETAVLALGIFLALQTSVQNFRVEGSSMDPTLGEGQYLLVNKLVYSGLVPRMADLLPFLDIASDDGVFPFHPPRRGEVIVFRYPEDPSRDFVKRVIGLPGDVVEIRRGDVYVNGVLQDEPYLVKPHSKSMPPTEVPPDSYFVLGDNRQVSNDSRDWGAVPMENIVGRALVTYWPLNTLHAVGNPD